MICVFEYRVKKKYDEKKKKLFFFPFFFFEITKENGESRGKCNTK